jgi:hypothetical protein
MRVNVYAEEMTNRVELVTKKTEDGEFTGVRFYLELPMTVNGVEYKGPFLHQPGDDDSAAVTFWGKRQLRTLLKQALDLLEANTDAEPADYLKPLEVRDGSTRN